MITTVRLIILFILLSLGADAQIIRANAQYVPLGCSGLLLDCYPKAAAAYSLRKLKSSYSGSAIRIRRDSTGNAETNIGFTANGDLDTTAIKNHCRNNSCMVTTWYNQGDSTSINFTQTTAASQPRIMTSGVIERRAGEPSIRFDNSGTADFMDVASSTVKFNYLHKAGQAALFMCAQAGLVSDPNTIYILFGNTINSANTGYRLEWNDRITTPNNDAISSSVVRGASGTFVSAQTIDNTLNANTFALITNLLDNSTATPANRNIFYINGTNEQKNNIQTGNASTANASFDIRLGAQAGVGTTAHLNGYISELILYSTNQSSNRTGIETNINNYYGIW